MNHPDKSKPSVVIVYTGNGKGKTSAGIGLVCRALGYGSRVAFIQFIKSWRVSEHDFFDSIAPVYGDNLTVYKGGRGFYNAGELSAAGVTVDEHKSSAIETYQLAHASVISGQYDLVVCDEINNAVHDGLLSLDQFEKLITNKHRDTSLCLTGRNFPERTNRLVDIMTDMKQIHHHYDDGFIANPGIDY